MINWFLPMLRGRCPVCHTGRIFRSFWRMNPRCPQCGIKFEREQGFFAMSIFVGEFLAALVAIPFLVFAWFLDFPLIWLVAVPGVAIVLLTPFIFRYGRIVWLYIDQWLDPRSSPTIDNP